MKNPTSEKPTVRAGQSAVRESTTQALILRRFATVAWCRVIRINTGIYLTQDGRRLVRTAPTGFPDLILILPDGRVGFIEAKSPRGRASAEQVAFGEMVRRFKGVYIVARSVDDVERVLRDEGYGEWMDGAAMPLIAEVA